MRQSALVGIPGIRVSKHIMPLLYPWLLYICFRTVNIHLSGDYYREVAFLLDWFLAAQVFKYNYAISFEI